jgi:hypothetical protein
MMFASENAMPDHFQGWLNEAVEEAHRRFSGTYEVVLDVLRDVPYPDAPWTQKRPDQRDLAWMRQQLGGDEGYLTDPSGKEHFVPSRVGRRQPRHSLLLPLEVRS